MLARALFLFFFLVSCSSALKCGCYGKPRPFGDLSYDYQPFCKNTTFCSLANETSPESCSAPDGKCYTEYAIWDDRDGDPSTPPVPHSSCCKKSLKQLLYYRVNDYKIDQVNALCSDKDYCSSKMYETVRACEKNNGLVYPGNQMTLPGRTNLTCKCNSGGMHWTRGGIWENELYETRGDPNWPFEPEEYEKFCVGDDEDEKRCYFDDILPKLKEKNITYFNDNIPMCQYLNWKDTHGERFFGAACIFVSSTFYYTRSVTMTFDPVIAEKSVLVICSEYSLCNNERHAENTGGLNAEFNIQCPKVYMERIRQTIQWPKETEDETQDPSLVNATYAPLEYKGSHTN